MSDLHKNLLKKKYPPLPKNTQQQSEDSGDEEEEQKDTFESQPIAEEVYQVRLPKPTSSAQPIKAVHSISTNAEQQQQSLPKTKKVHNYQPLQWNEFFDSREVLPNGTPIYIAGAENSPIFLCLHGAGHSAMSFACLARQIKQFAMCVAFDFRSHGSSQIESYDMSTKQLIADVAEMVEHLTTQYPNPTIIITGHSMGGAIAAKSTEYLLTTKFADRIQGLIVIDVVEGTAIEALPFMEQIVTQRPKGFKSYEQAIQWALNTSTLKHYTSARVSIPPQLREVKDEEGNLVKLVWKVNLLQTENHWLDWFRGLTNSFLSIRIPKILMLAERERLDKELMVAQMQGKFRLIVLPDTGHSIQEDDPANTAQAMHEFLNKFRVPATYEELMNMKEHGVGQFHPSLKPFKRLPE